MKNWIKTTLEDAPCEIIDGDRGKNYPSQDDFCSNGTCIFLNTKNININKFDFSRCVFITDEKDNQLNKGKLKLYDIVMTTRGTIGNIALFDDKTPFNSLRINSGMVIIRPIVEKINYKFLYYTLNNLRYSFDSYISGTAQPQLPIKDLKKVSFLLPPLPEQKAIASVLSSLDDKIDLLSRRVNLYYKLIELLYRYFFIDFIPFQDENLIESELSLIPKNWHIVSLSDIVEIHSGYAYKSSELQSSKTAMATIKNFNKNKGFKIDGFKEIIPDKTIKKHHFVDLFDVIVAHTDLTQNAEIVGNTEMVVSKSDYENIIISTDLVKVTPKKPYINNFFLTAILSNDLFKQHALKYINGTTVLHLSKKAIPEYKIVLPYDTKIISEASVYFEIFYRSISSTLSQQQNLIKLLNILLPKLISGEIKVNS
jgi:type I restriction enzyme S subunit